MRRFAFIALVLLWFSAFTDIAADESWKIFDDRTIGDVKILINPAYLNSILDPANAKSDSLFPAAFYYRNAIIPGDTVLLIGFRIRGNTSRTSAKKSFKIDFNHFVPGRKFYGLEKMNLNGEHNDPSIMRSKLCWDLFQQIRVPASRANHVRLYINDKYYGLYINVEHVDDEFVQKRFGNQNGNLYKCLWPADLVYLGPDQQLYKKFFGDRQAYELMTNKDKNDYSDLVHFIDVLNNTPASQFKIELEKVFNVDNFLKWLALNVLVGSWDDYWYLKNNYYLYHNTATDKFEFIPYDYDNTYGIDWVGGDWATRNIYRWGNMQEKRPLVTRILELPEYRYRYTLYLETFMNNEFSFEAQEPRIDQLKAMITPAVAADSFRILDWDFSISDFHQSFETSVPTKYNHVPYGIKPYIKLRIASATSQLATFYPPPVVINEFMASNKRTLADEYGEYDDWIELYNADSQPFNVKGMFLSDDPAHSTRWMLPDTTIAPKGFLLIWADGDPTQGKLHTNFRLSADGEQLVLFATMAEGNYLIDTRTFNAQQTDVSYGRLPDGGKKWSAMPPTPGAPNKTETLVADGKVSSPENFELSQNYPNPFNASTRIQFHLPMSGKVTLQIFNLSGQMVKILADTYFSAGSHALDWNGQDDSGNPVTSGTYFYQLKTESFQMTRKMVLLR
ncbi:MAG: CotH kinase family protein [candidate division KSB1 bacterium]|nr:CotH kinase family protein [candidate division KSB1 bacterium]